MKKFLGLMGCFLLMTVGFQSCNKSDEGSLDLPTEDDVNLHSPEVDVKYKGKAVILGVNGNDAANMLDTFSKLIPNTQQSVDEDTDLLIVPELSEAYEDQLLAMYKQGGVIAIVNPSREDLDDWYEKHGWIECTDQNKMNETLIYSFSPSHHCIVTKPDDKDIHLEEGDGDAGVEDDNDLFFDHLIDDIHSEDAIKDDNYLASTDTDYEMTTSYVEDNFSKMYTNLHPWITILNEDLETAEEVKTRADGTSSTDVSKIFMSFPYGKTYPYSVDAKVRKWGVFKADRIKGNASIGVSFDIYQIHCYDDQPGAGDYYLVDMTASVANSDLYKGKWWNNHAGTLIRICGLYAKSFEIECTPVDAVTKEPIGTERIAFTAQGFPSPATTTGQTTYDKSHSFDLGVALSISLSKKHTTSQSNDPSAPITSEDKSGIEGGAEMTFGWSWTNSESRSISDTDISNTTMDNRVGYRLDFNNLPKFQWSASRGFNEGNSRTFRSTVDIRSSWIWHVKDAQDDSDAPPIAIRFRAKPTYGAMSFVTTKADLKTVKFDNFGNIEDYIELKPFIREQCANIIVQNDFKNNVSVKNTRFYRVDRENNKEVLIWDSRSTIKPGGKIKTEPLHIVNEYIVRFTTTDDREFEYSSYDSIKLERGEQKVLYTATDFKQVK